MIVMIYMIAMIYMITMINKPPRHYYFKINQDIKENVRDRSVWNESIHGQRKI